MDQMLKAAAEEGNIDKLYTLFREDPYLQECIDHIPFVDTPLHKAASLGHTQFVMEIMRLKPSFAQKQNQDGFTPVHLALQHGKTKMLGLSLHLTRLHNKLFDMDCDIVQIEGKEGKTPLHYAAEEGNLDLLTKFLLACPQSIQDVTIRGETALHIAVKNYNLEAFDLMVGKLRRAHHEGAKIQETTILNWKDKEGNTALHIAALTNQPHASSYALDSIPNVVSVLLYCQVDKHAKNLEGLTTLDISELQRQEDNSEVKKMLQTGHSNASLLPSHCKSKLSPKKQVLTSFMRFKTNIKEDKRNVQLVVAILIVTATYQSALSPPRGVWQDDNNNSTISNRTHKLVPEYEGKAY
ncbi:hypothetical protein UlMin_001492 [Ulmus minor]